MNKIILAADIGGTTCKLGILMKILTVYQNGQSIQILQILLDIYY